MARLPDPLFTIARLLVDYTRKQEQERNDRLARYHELLKQIPRYEPIVWHYIPKNRKDKNRLAIRWPINIHDVVEKDAAPIFQSDIAKLEENSKPCTDPNCPFYLTGDVERDAIRSE